MVFHWAKLFCSLYDIANFSGADINEKVSSCIIKGRVGLAESEVGSEKILLIEKIRSSRHKEQF